MNTELVKLAFAAKAVLREKQAYANADFRRGLRSKMASNSFEEGRRLGLDAALPAENKRIQELLDACNESFWDSRDPRAHGYNLGFRRRLVAERLRNKDLKGTVDSEDGGYLTSTLSGTAAGGLSGNLLGYAGGGAFGAFQSGGKGARPDATAIVEAVSEKNTSTPAISLEDSLNGSEPRASKLKGSKPLTGARAVANKGGKYGGIAGLVLGLLSSLVANSQGAHNGRYGKLRSRDEQKKYERGSKWLNRLVPGQANYNREQSIRYSDFV